jgi:glycosyltransferase involved in cell wall biosynthesis
VKVAFLVNDLQLSGGVGVVVRHARGLAADHGFDVSLVLVRDWDLPHWSGYDDLPHLHVISLEEARDRRFDVAVATWWETTFSLFTIPAKRYAYFVQSLEDRFYEHDQAERVGAGLTLDLPVAFITEARWIQQTVAELRPDAPCHLVRNGIDKDVFVSPKDVEPNVAGPLRVLIEGDPTVWFKGVKDAATAAAAVREPRRVTVVTGRPEFLDVTVDRVVTHVPHREMAGLYADSDVVLKLSRVEGMFGPPLEGFHMGATCVTTEVTGHDEYIEHGRNALLVDWDDRTGTTRQLELLAKDRRLLHELRCNALATAHGWPDWSQATQFMALALRRIAVSKEPSAASAAAAMMADLRGGIEQYNVHLQERLEFAREAAKLEKVKALPGIAQANRVRQSRAGRLGIRLLRRLLGR